MRAALRIDAPLLEEPCADHTLELCTLPVTWVKKTGDLDISTLKGFLNITKITIRLKVYVKVLSVPPVPLVPPVPPVPPVLVNSTPRRAADCHASRGPEGCEGGGRVAHALWPVGCEHMCDADECATSHIHHVAMVREWREAPKSVRLGRSAQSCDLCAKRLRLEGLLVKQIVLQILF